MHTIDSNKYNDIVVYQGSALYDINRRLMWAIQLDTTGNSSPIYVSISDGTTEITNLEMCSIEDGTYVIDLAPFIQTLFKNTVPMWFDDNTNALLKKITLIASNLNEDPIAREIYCTTRRYKNVEVINQDEWTVETSTSGVFYSDVETNDLSDILLPDADMCRVVQETFSFDENYYLGLYRINNSVSRSTTSIDVRKRLANRTLVDIGQRKVVRQQFCENKNLCILYRSPYGQYEYFVFDNFTVNTRANKKEPVSNKLYKTDYLNAIGDIYGESIEKTISASVFIKDELFASKWNDIISSTQVYVYNPEKGTLANGRSFEKVTLEGEYNFNPRRGTRQNITLRKNTEYVW